MTKQDGRHSKAGKQSRGQTWRGARALYLQNVPVVDIARLLGVSRVPEDTGTRTVSQMTEVPFKRNCVALSSCYIPPGVLKIRGKSSVADRIGSFCGAYPRGFFHGGRNQVLEFSYADSLSEIFEKGQSCPRVFFRTLFAER